MSIKKWASAAAANIRSIREVKPDKPGEDSIGGVPERSQPKPEGGLTDDDWFEDPAEPGGIPERESNSNRTDADDPTGTDRTFNKLNGSGVTGSGSGNGLEPRNNYHSG